MPGARSLDPHARTLAAGDLEAVFCPARGMLGASLRHRGQELLGRVGDLRGSAEGGSTAGIPLLYPWANRLGSLRFHACGRTVALDRASALLHLDANGLPIHGVPWSRLRWRVSAERPDRLEARLEWSAEPLLAVFPFVHTVELRVTLDPEGLELETIVLARDEPVPVSFGFHPYLAAPAGARLTLPPMRRLVLDPHGLPTGAEVPFAGGDGPLERELDDGFAGVAEGAVLALEGGGRRISVRLLEGFPCAQVYAPAPISVVALEPMTARTNALVSGRDLSIVERGGRYRARFRIDVEA